MSAPVPAVTTCAVVGAIPGMEQIRSQNPRKGAMTGSVRSVSSAIAAGVLVHQTQVQADHERVVLGVSVAMKKSPLVAR